MDIFAECKSVARLIDAVLRGSKADVYAAETTCKGLFDKLMHLSDDEAKDMQKDTPNSHELLNLAVSLINKVRNIPSGTPTAVKGYVKAIGARMLTLYCNPTNTIKAATKGILLLAKAADDMRAFSESQHPDIESDSSLCLRSAIQMWSNLPENTLDKVILASEIEELKQTVFHVYLDLAGVAHKSTGGGAVSMFVQQAYNMLVVDSTGSASSDFIETSENKLMFSKTTIKLAVALSKSTSPDELNESCKLLKMCLHILEKVKEQRCFEEKTRLQSIALLCFIEVSVKLDQFDKAETCVTLLESVLTSAQTSKHVFTTLNLSVIFTELNILRHKLLLQKGDVTAAEELMTSSLAGAQDGSPLIGAVLLHTSTIADCADAHKRMSTIFTVLLQKLSADPTYTDVRLEYLKSLLLSHSSMSDDIGEGIDDCLSLCAAIIHDQSTKTHTMTPSQVKRFRKLMFERIQINNLKNCYAASLKWISLQETLSADDVENDMANTLLLQKAEILHRLGRVKESHEAAKILSHSETSTPSILMEFKATLGHCGCDAALAVLTETLSAIDDPLTNMSRISLCATIAHLASDEEATIRVLRYWLHYFREKQVWKHLSSDDISEAKNQSFTSVLCALADLFSLRYIKNTANANRKRKLSDLGEVEQEDDVTPSTEMETPRESSIKSLSQRSEPELTSECSPAALAETLADGQQLLGLIREDPTIDPKLIGTTEELTWYRQYLFQLGVITLQQREEPPVEASHDLAAQMFEMSSKISEALLDKSDSNIDHITNSLLLAAAIRLDAHSIVSSSAHISEALADILRCISLLAVDSNAQLTNRYKSALAIHFAILVRKSNVEAEAFIESHTQDLLRFTTSEVMHLVDVSLKESAGTNAQANRLLSLALQICMQTHSNFEEMGEIFQQLIRLSPSRKEALNRIIEFEQLLKVSKPESGSEGFSPDVVDEICKLSYNYGLSLYTFNQIDLAEVFIGKAIALLQFTSERMILWRSSIEEAHAVILKAKIDASAQKVDTPDQRDLDAESKISSAATFADVTAKSLLNLL